MISLLRQNCRRALSPCKAHYWPASVLFLPRMEISGHLQQQKQTILTERIRIALVRKNWLVSDLARAINRPRNSVSLVVHQRRNIPAVEAEVRKELGI